MEKLLRIADFMNNHLDMVNKNTYFGEQFKTVDSDLLYYAPSNVFKCKAKTTITKVGTYESRTNWLEQNGGEDWVTTRGHTFTGDVELEYTTKTGESEKVVINVTISLASEPFYRASSQLDAIKRIEENGINDEDFRSLMFGVGCSTNMVIKALCELTYGRKEDQE